MTLTSGVRLGPYEILDAIGAGGMGEVYKARDTRLERTVAIKVLPGHIADRADLRQRFDREARAVSSLNHPHICTLHDIGQQDGVDYLVMEYLEGETLAQRLTKGPLALDQALRCAIEVAEALAQAHKQGVFHRDLKPGNIMLTKAGAKLLDFGLAKLRQTAAAGSVSQLPTEIGELTQKGTILGTFQYMPPEQLEGKETDARGDLFAFGAVLYEIVTGRKAFQGTSHASLIAAIMHTQPAPVSAVQPMTPPALDYVVQKCLAKDPDERWQSAADLAAQLKWISQSGTTTVAAATTPLPAASAVTPAPSVVAAAPARRRSIPLAWAAATVLLLASTVALAILHFRETPPKLHTVRFQVPAPEKGTSNWYDIPVLSPDGQRVAFTILSGENTRQLWVRPLDSLISQSLPGTEGAIFPFWSPDSRSIAFFAQGKLKKVDASGGPVQTLAESGGCCGAWSRDGVILFSPPGSKALHRVAAAGGEPKPFTALDTSRQESDHVWPHFLPDGRRFLYAALGSQADIAIGSLDSKEVKRLALPASNAAYAAGHLIYPRGDTLMAQPFDADKLALSGDAFPIAERLEVNAGGLPGAVFSVSDNGALAFRSAGELRTQLIWFDRNGKRLETVGEPADYSNPALSPDEKKVAVGRRDPQTKTRDIWIFDLARGASSRLTFDPAEDLNPLWSPDGTRIAFVSTRNKGHRDIYEKSAAGTGGEQLVLESDQDKPLEDWSPDGRFLLYNYPGGAKTGLDIWALPLTGDRKPLPVIQDPFRQERAQVSPNGRWIAYNSGESGKPEVFVQTFPPSGGKWQVSTAGGTEPRWRGDSKELYYAADNKIMAVEVKTDGRNFEAGIPKPLFEVNLSSQAINRNRFVVTKDGKRFLVNLRLQELTALPMTIVLNWPASVKR